MRSLLRLLGLGVLTVAACGDPTPTQIVLLVDADFSVRERADALRVTLRGQAGADLTETVLVYGDDEAIGFPRPIAVVPRGGDADRSLEAVVEALEAPDAASFVSARLIADFVAEQQLLIRITLTADCIDVAPTCTDTETCMAGVCADAREAWPEEPFEERTLPSCPAGTVLDDASDACVPAVLCDPGSAPTIEGTCEPCDETQHCPGGAQPAVACTQWRVTDRDPATACPTTIALTAGQDHACALADTGAVSCWGSTASGATAVPPLPGHTAGIAAGTFHTCALSEGGEVTCWGSDSQGQLQVPPLSGAPIRIAAGAFHTCTLSDTAVVQCWGDDAAGQATVPALPGTTVAVAAGGSQSCALSNAGDVTCWGDAAPVPPLPETTVALSVGSGHACARSDGGSVTCWGNDGDGESSVPPLDGEAASVAAGFRHSCAAHGAGEVTCWGASFDGILDPPALPGETVELVAGSDFTCARTDAGEVTCWGRNEQGAEAPDPLGTLRAGCDVLAQTGCFEGEACRHDGLGLSRCVEEGEVPVSGVCDEVNPCVVGAVCITGRCIGYCDTTDGLPECEPVASGSSVGLLFPACDPFLQNCWTGWGCDFGSAAMICLPAGLGTDGDACSSKRDCSPDHTCVTFDGVSYACQAFCDSAAQDCSFGSCVAFDTSGDVFWPDNLGACDTF